LAAVFLDVGDGRGRWRTGCAGWFLFPIRLAAGLRAVFVALAVFAYEVVLFPLSVLADYSLERLHGRLDVGIRRVAAWVSRRPC
jgi:hypothetical protein